MAPFEIIIANPLIDNLFERFHIILFPEEIPVFRFESSVKGLHVYVFLGSGLRIGDPGFGAHNNLMEPAVADIDAVLIVMDENIGICFSALLAG